ncbi:MAG: hypothetical protein K2Z80_26160 [Xanthobacteraceae bacterium]|nr:hypothetical protein [Xanthobacteraceae bacterium]
MTFVQMRAIGGSRRNRIQKFQNSIQTNWRNGLAHLIAVPLDERRRRRSLLQAQAGSASIETRIRLIYMFNSKPEFDPVLTRRPRRIPPPIGGPAP